MEGAQSINIILADVLSVEDKAKGGRIKVRLASDIGSTVSQLPYAYPLLPQFFRVIPKVGEKVLILLAESGVNTSNRFYIGPIISQLQNLEYENGDLSIRLFNDNPISTETSPDEVEDAQGAYADDKDIAIYGRKGSDIILKENEVEIRCGDRKEDSESPIGISYNPTTSANIVLSYNDTEQKASNPANGQSDLKYNSAALITGDQIVIAGNDSNSEGKDTKIDELIAKAHATPYGDILVEFLEEFRTIFKEHAHPYPGEKPILPAGRETFYNYDISSILSKSVKTL